MNLYRSNYQSHFYFILLLAIQYLVSIIFIGEIIVEPHDNLANAVVHVHVISEIYKGNNELKTICFKCNNSNHIFLYKII